MRSCAAGLVFVAVVCFALGASAQETGGSFDSSDWESSSGSSDWGSSSGSSDWGSSSGSSYPTTDYDTSPSTSYSPARGDDGTFLFIFLAIVVLFVVLPVVLASYRAGGPMAAVYRDGHIPVVGPRPVAGLVDVSMLQLAVDWRARKFVQATLATLAREGDTASKEGRARLLRAATKALLSVKLAWLYAGARNFSPMPRADAQREFQLIANDVRSTFRQEIVRASAGRVVSVEAVGVRAKEHEGPGVVLVSVIVASRREIFDVDERRSASIEGLLRSLSLLGPDDVIALSVVWTPAAEDDRMSTDELEARHRYLVKLGDVGGRVFCAYCGGPHAEELATCPHCGAPSAAKSSAPSA